MDPKYGPRKPGIGMLVKGAKELGLSLDDFGSIYFIGNSAVDVQTGLNADGKGILVCNGKNREEKEKLDGILADESKKIVVPNFYEAAQRIIDDLKK